MPRVESWKFSELPEYGKRLIQEWRQRSEVIYKCTPEESFEPFIYAWFALNSWAVCVTGIERDGQWQRTLAENEALDRELLELVSTDKEFANIVNNFQILLPIFKVQDTRRISKSYFTVVDDLEKRKVRNAQWLADGVDHAPSDWKSFADKGQAFPIKWKYLLEALARVRNNLFHGDKSAASLVDQTVVYRGALLLVTFVERSQTMKG